MISCAWQHRTPFGHAVLHLELELKDIIVTDEKVRVLAVEETSLIIEAIHPEEDDFLDMP